MPDPIPSPAQIKPEQVFEILVRRKWLIVIPLCFTLTLGLIFTLTAQKTYSASTLILVQQQRVPTEYVRSVITSSINQRINTISQQILSRSNLEKIIAQFGLYLDQDNLYLEDKIAGMRKRINVKIERARHGAEAFSISFKGSDPRKVMQIANTLASFFMDENIKVREAQAIGTSEFLDAELEKTRKKLEEREKRLSAFRSKYLGGLPDELETNLRTLDRLQEQMASKNDMLREHRAALTQVNHLLNQARTEESSRKKITRPSSGEKTGESIISEEDQLFLAQKAYDELLTSYTEKHPDVVKARKHLEKLKKNANSQASEPEKEGEPVSEPGTGSALVKQLLGTKAQVQDDIKRTQEDIETVEKKMALYQSRVEETPKRELELQSLKRDYANIRDIFNSLLDRKLEAELSVNMEKKQKGEQFRILDHARLPEKPISPNIKKFLLFSLIAGLGLGGGIVFLLEFFDSAIRRDEQIEDELGLTILASIPKLSRAGDKNKGRMEILFFIFTVVYLGAVLSFFVILNSKGIDRTLNFIKLYTGL